MAERLVVCFRWRGALAATAEEFVIAADQLCRRAAALGGRITAWHAGAFAFDFTLDALEDAMELLIGEKFPDALSVGVAQGVLRPFVESSRVTLGWGPALIAANALARLAHPGEILLDPAMQAVRSCQLLSDGGRLGRVLGERVRGVRLDVRYPWRVHVADSVCRLQEGPYFGALRPADIARRLEPKTLALVSGDPGLGGTRTLFEVKAEAQVPSLLIVPGVTGEPLGALRIALARAELETPPRAPLPPRERGLLLRLLRGEGIDPSGGAALISESVGPNGLVIIDDAGELDSDSLEAVAAACIEFDLRLIVRLSMSDRLPEPLTELARGPEPVISPVATEHRVELLRSLCGGMLDNELALCWSHRGGSSPLAMREALAASLESGELVWNEQACVPRVSTTKAASTQSAEHWIGLRLALLDGPPRMLIEALCVLGGSATFADLESMLEKASAAEREVTPLAEQLTARGWLRRFATDTLTIASRTQKNVVLQAMTDERLRQWQRVASRTLEQCGRPLSAAAAALHALLAGEPDRAATLARRAAGSARDAGLFATAAALERFSISGEQPELASRALCGSFTWEVGVGFPGAGAPNGGGPSNGRDRLQAEARAASSNPPPRRSSTPPRARSALGELTQLANESEALISANFAQALRDGDLETVRRMVTDLRKSSDNVLLADRLEAMAHLSRGETGQALRLLRRAKERAPKADLVGRSRAALALAIALAAAGRAGDALLEALEGLARARESGDVSGERACARFLGQLSLSASDEGAARVWQAVTSN